MAFGVWLSLPFTIDRSGRLPAGQGQRCGVKSIVGIHSGLSLSFFSEVCDQGANELLKVFVRTIGIIPDSVSGRFLSDLGPVGHGGGMTGFALRCRAKLQYAMIPEHWVLAQKLVFLLFFCF